MEGLGTVDILFGTYYSAATSAHGPCYRLGMVGGLLAPDAFYLEVVPATIEGSTQAPVAVAAVPLIS